MQQDVSTALYYAAIANALFFYSENISKSSKDKLIQSLSALIRAEWLLLDLAILFKKAQFSCQKTEQ